MPRCAQKRCQRLSVPRRRCCSAGCPRSPGAAGRPPGAGLPARLPPWCSALTAPWVHPLATAAALPAPLQSVIPAILWLDASSSKANVPQSSWPHRSAGSGTFRLSLTLQTSPVVSNNPLNAAFACPGWVTEPATPGFCSHPAAAVGWLAQLQQRHLQPALTAEQQQLTPLCLDRGRRAANSCPPAAGAPHWLTGALPRASPGCAARTVLPASSLPRRRRAAAGRLGSSYLGASGGTRGQHDSSDSHREAPAAATAPSWARPGSGRLAAHRAASLALNAWRSAGGCFGVAALENLRTPSRQRSAARRKSSRGWLPLARARVAGGPRSHPLGLRLRLQRGPLR